MLTVNHLQKKFDDHLAVDDVSFMIMPGEVFSLIGPNSSGKTTIVRSIAGLLRIDGGSISIGGHDISKDPIAAKALVGYIPDEPSVWSSMTGEEFLHFVGALYGMNSLSRAQKISALLPLFMFNGIEKDRFQDYSRGNKQKFSILAALLHEPKLLLIDEPIVGLDPESAIIAKHLFRDFAARGGAVLLVTHTLSVAEEIATRIGILKQGSLVAVGTFDELKHEALRPLSATLEDVYTTLAGSQS